MLKIVADDKIPFLKESPLASLAEMRFLPGGKIDHEALKEADALITRTRTKCRQEILAGTSVRFIATATIGFDHIDTRWCDVHGIVWKNAPGCNAASVGQYMSSLLLNLNQPLKGKTLGIIGVGHVGKKVLAAAQALGLRVLLNDPPRERAEGKAAFTGLETLLKESDFVTTHVPLEKEGQDPTFHLADRTFFRKMKPSAHFINASRGEVASNGDLKEALRDHVIAGASLDVWENEPEIDRELMEMLTFATPHVAGYSTDGKANGTSMSVRAVAEFFALPGLSDWYPENVPLPLNTTVTLTGTDHEDLLRQAVNASYDIREDTKRLRQSPELFEKLRGTYPLRREFPAFRIAGKESLPGETVTALGKLGFRF